MSRENVEVVRSSIEEFAVTQKPTGLTAPDFVWDMRGFRGWPDKDEYHGADGFLEFFRRWVDAYDEWTMQADTIRDADGDRVLAIIRQRGRLRGASSWVEALYGTVYTLENGRIKRIQWYATPEEALEAVGLRE